MTDSERLAEATALLAEADEDWKPLGGWQERYKAFLSRAPAQPTTIASARAQALQVQIDADAGLVADRAQSAAPQPPAPELSGDRAPSLLIQDVAMAQLRISELERDLEESEAEGGDLQQRAETAEAKLAAVASVSDTLVQLSVEYRRNPQVHSTYAECAVRIDRALLRPTPEPAQPAEPDGAEIWYCTHCPEANVTRSDEDRCCLSCGVDLVERKVLLELLGVVHEPTLVERIEAEIRDLIRDAKGDGK